MVAVAIPGFTEVRPGVLEMYGQHGSASHPSLRTVVFVLETGQLLLCNAGNFGETAPITWAWFLANKGELAAILVANGGLTTSIKAAKDALGVPLWSVPSAKAEVPCDFVFGSSVPPWADELLLFLYPGSSGDSEYAFFHKRSKVFVATDMRTPTMTTTSIEASLLLDP